MNEEALSRALLIFSYLLSSALLTPGVQAQTVTLSPASWSFPNGVVGTTSAAAKFTLKNSQSVALAITGISTTLSDYATTNNCPSSPATLAAGASCTISVTFTPSAAGSRTGALTVTHDAPGSPQTVSLTGTGIVPVTIAPSSLTFGSQPEKTKSAVQTITLHNNQASAVTISQIIATSADFLAATTCPLSPNTLAAGGNCKISVTFDPTAVGTLTAALTVTDNATTSPQSAALSGTGTAPILVSIAVAPQSASIPLGQTEQFRAIGTYSDGSTQDLTNVVAWKSSATSVTAINASGLATTIGQGSSTITATKGTINGTTRLTVTVPVLVSMVVTPKSATLPLGRTGQFKATGTYSNGSTKNISSTAVWTSFSPSIAAISGAGLATADGLGITNVTAAVGTILSSATLTVTPAVLVSIAITPAAASIAKGQTQQLAATGTYSDGSTKNLTAMTWTSSAPAVATVTSKGLTIGVSQGTTIISATAGSVTGSGSVTVNPPALVKIAVTPTTASIPNGTTQQFTATGTYTDGSTQNLSTSVSWSSSAPAIASISSGGLASALGMGGTLITASAGTVFGSSNLVVGQPGLVSIAVTPANPAFALGTTQPLHATGTYSDGSTLDLTASTTWNTANPAIATVNGQGLASGMAIGTTTVRATSGLITGSTTLMVSPATLVSIAITPAVPAIALGTTEQFTATGTFSDGSTQNVTNTVLWSSDTPAVTTISNVVPSQGLASSVGIGTATIMAASGSISNSTTLTVTAAVLVSIAVTPASASIALGATQPFTATATFSDGSTQDVTSTVQWSSDTLPTATIANTGLATSTGIGTATITATSGTVAGSTVLTVTAATLVSIVINPQTASIALGTTQPFTATGTYTDGTTQDLTQSGHWSSAVATVAIISNSAGTNGVATSEGSGTTTIGISSGSVSASATLSVNAAALVSIAISPQSANIPLGTAQQFTATGTYTDGSHQDLTSTVQWSSSSAAVAIISNTAGSNGLATSAGVGTTPITAISGSISAVATLTVTVAQVNPINIVFGLSYDSINPTTRTFGLWYNASHSVTDPTLPIVVYLHGGQWKGGSGFGKLGQVGVFAPGACPDISTVVCYLANIGYAVYSINYTLTIHGNLATQWPVQWQDCDCFLKFLAEQAGVTVPGNPHKIILLGDSAGAHLAAMAALAPHNSFPSNCGHASVNYTVLGIDLVSPPIDLHALFEVNTTPNWQGVDGSIADLLGCRPGPSASDACLAIAASADPANYVAQGQPLVLVQTGLSDNQIPYQLQGALQTAYAALNPPVQSQWIVYGSTYGHDLDLFYYSPCSSDPAPEPSPCGTAGAAFGDTLRFLSSLPGR